MDDGFLSSSLNGNVQGSSSGRMRNGKAQNLSNIVDFDNNRNSQEEKGMNSAQSGNGYQQQAMEVVDENDVLTAGAAHVLAVSARMSLHEQQRALESFERKKEANKKFANMHKCC